METMLNRVTIVYIAQWQPATKGMHHDEIVCAKLFDGWCVCVRVRTKRNNK